MVKLNRLGEKYLTNEGYWVTITEYFSKRDCSIEFEDGTIIKNRNFSNIKKGSVRNVLNKVGEKFINNQGYEAEIVEWFNANNCTIKFKNTEEIVKNVSYIQITTKSIKRPKECRIGEKYLTNEGCEIEIVEYFNSGNVTIQFKDGLKLPNRSYLNVQQGGVKNPNHPSVYGVGYEGIGKYTSKINFKCYNIWRGIMRRCYSIRHKNNQPSYAGCSIDPNWHNFQNFARWHEENYNIEIMQGWEIDKDIIKKGNKIYSPYTCEIVPKKINLLFVKNDKSRGNLPIGVKKSGKRFKAKVMKNNKEEDLGNYSTPEEAFQVYKIAKEEHIKDMANRYKGKITNRCYEAMYNYQVEITD